MTSPGEPAAAPESSDGSGLDRWSRPMKMITEIGSMAALLTALLYYFGWARSEAQARAFGADASVFAMSTQDFVLRSVDVLFLPAFVLLALGYLAIRLHRRLVVRGDPSRMAEVASASKQRPVLARFAKVLRFSWALAALIAVALLCATPSAGAATLPLWIALGIIGTVYGAALRRLSTDQKGQPPLAIAIVVAALIGVTMFWAAERFARVAGESKAADIKASMAETLKPVTIYSSTRLYLTGPQVDEIRIGQDEPGYQYRYHGLYLLQRSGAKYFLLTRGWERDEGKLVVLPDNDAIRVEFGGTP